MKNLKAFSLLFPILNNKMSWKIQNKKTNQFLKSPDWSKNKVLTSVDSFWVDSGETLFEDLNEAIKVVKRLDYIFGEKISKIVEV